MNRRRHPTGPLAGLAISLTLLAAACGGSAYGAASPSPAPTAAATTPPSPGATAAPSAAPSQPPSNGALQVTVATGTAGTYLAGRDGLALYVFKKDSGTTSSCYDACATAWPPLLVGAGETTTAGAGVGGTFGTTSRTDGTTQVTYDGAPLYYFAGDSTAGDTNGQGLNGVWFLATP